MKGSCNCKKVTFNSSDAVKAIVNCHCNLCRKMNGAAFSTYVVVPESQFSLIGDTIGHFKVSSHSTKYFCTECGTPIYNQNPKLNGVIIIHLGAIDTQVEIQPAINIFCESQLSWVNKLSSFKCFEQGLV